MKDLWHVGSIKDGNQLIWRNAVVCQSEEKVEENVRRISADRNIWALCWRWADESRNWGVSDVLFPVCVTADTFDVPVRESETRSDPDTASGFDELGRSGLIISSLFFSPQWEWTSILRLSGGEGESLRSWLLPSIPPERLIRSPKGTTGSPPGGCLQYGS